MSQSNWKLQIPQDIIEFMALHGIYPMITKNGKIFLKCAKKGFLTPDNTKEIIQKLNIKTKEDCDLLREKIKNKIAEGRINSPIKKWIKEERPREMLAQQGAENLPLSKLLAIILRTGMEGMSAEELAKNLLNKYGSLRAIDMAPISELSKIKGIGFVKAVQIKAALELGKRLIKESAQKKKKLKNPDDVVNYILELYGPYLRDKTKEHFFVVMLDVKNKPIASIELSKGSINSTIVDPKEIIKEASLKSASSIILVHNHPSGETTPSPEDIEVTKRINKACNIVGIKLLDHIIIGKNFEDFYSFAQEGIIKE